MTLTYCQRKDKLFLYNSEIYEKCEHINVVTFYDFNVLSVETQIIYLLH